MVSEAFLAELPALVKSGEVRQDHLDAAVMRVLETKWDLGLFLDPFARCDEERAGTIHLSSDHRRLAREAARESVVLLKNDGDLLPLAKQGKIAVIGPLADSRRDMLGCWIAAGDEAAAASPLDGIREAVGDRAKVVFAKGCEILTGHEKWLDEAKQAASEADVVVLVLGEGWQMSGEAASRTDIRLPKCQRKLAQAILKTGKPCVLVTMSGRPLDLSWEDAKFPAILHAWALGTEGGRALADLLFGDAAPVGKLTMGFPRSVGQLPMTYREKPTGRPFDAAVQYSSKYLDAANEPLYPFGHGLTYGKFRFGNPTLDAAEMKPGGVITVFTEVTNLSAHPATETVQLYLRDLVASVSRPVKELRGYRRVTLDAGETRVVAFEITDEDLSFPGRDFRPVVEPGEFEAMTGPDSADVRAVRFVRDDIEPDRESRSRNGSLPQGNRPRLPTPWCHSAHGGREARLAWVPFIAVVENRGPRLADPRDLRLAIAGATHIGSGRESLATRLDAVPKGPAPRLRAPWQGVPSQRAAETLGDGDIAGGRDKFFKLLVGHLRGVHPEGIHGDPVDGQRIPGGTGQAAHALAVDVRPHGKLAARNPHHAIRRGGGGRGGIGLRRRECGIRHSDTGEHEYGQDENGGPGGVKFQDEGAWKHQFG